MTALPEPIEQEEDLSPILARLSKDLKAAATALTEGEARFLVDYYYTAQRNRIRAGNQVRQSEGEEPNGVIRYFFSGEELFESRIKAALNIYTDASEVGKWLKSIVGIGPVLAAGLMAHIHIREAPTAGHIWRHAGLDPTCQWLGPEKTKAVVNTVATASVVSDEQVVALSALLGRNPAKVRDLLIRGAEKAHNPTAPTGKTAVITVLSKRPHNAKLKVITWKAGQSFLKMSGNEKCLYGHIYKERKALEWERNLRGDFREQAQRDLADKKYGAETTARPWYAGDYLGIDAKGDPIPATEKGAGTPMLSPAHIDARARRYAVKLFLSHLHEVMYWVEYQDLPPAPYIFRDLKHSHYIEVPNLNVVPGLQNAKEKAKGKEA